MSDGAGYGRTWHYHDQDDPLGLWLAWKYDLDSDLDEAVDAVVATLPGWDELGDR